MASYKEMKNFTFDYLTKSNAGKNFLLSQESKQFFLLDEGIRWISGIEGKKWLETKDGMEWYLNFLGKNDDKLVQTKNWEQFIVNIFTDKSGKTNDLEFLKFIFGWKFGNPWISSPFGKEKFNEIFCNIGHIVLNTDVGYHWADTNFGRKVIFSIGNDFLNGNGKEWIMGRNDDVIFSLECREWILREGLWLICNPNWFFCEKERFLNWILSDDVPFEFKEKYFNSQNAELMFMNEGCLWFYENGENLYNKKLIGKGFNSYDEFRQKMLYEHMKTKFKPDEMNLVETFVYEDGTPCKFEFLEFLLNWYAGIIWTDLSRGKEIFIDYFCEVGDCLLKTKAGKKWTKTLHGRRMLAFIGNKFFQTTNGKYWLFDEDGREFLDSKEGKEWLFREGDWVFYDDRWVCKDNETFLNWIYNAPDSIKTKFFKSIVAEYMYMNSGFFWLEKNGSKLFNQKLIGDGYDTFEKYREYLIAEEQKMDRFFP